MARVALHGVAIWAVVAAVGCRQLLGIDSPSRGATDPTMDAAFDAMIDASIDAPCPDSDHDGVCDSVDDWPCGAKPAAPPATVTDNVAAVTLAITAISVAGGQLAVVAPNAAVTYGFSYDLHDTGCGNNCIDQIEIGLVPGMRLACPFDGVVSKTMGAQGTVSAQAVTAPSTPGSYDVRINVGQNFSCTGGGATNWWPTGAAPPSSLTIAKLCVH